MRGKYEYLVAGCPAGVVLGHVEWQGEGSERGLRESLAAGDPSRELAGGLHTLACGSVTSLWQQHVGGGSCCDEELQ